MAAAAAAEKANGGKFTDPLFYKPEHQAFWRDVIRTAFDAVAKAKVGKEVELEPPSLKEIADFSDHCVYIRSVFRFATRILRDSTEEEHKAMHGTAPLFFEDMAQVLAEYAVISASRVTDPATDRWNNESLTVEMFTKSLASKPDVFALLDEAWQRMKKLREKIRPARNKLCAHADREAIRSGKPLGMASWQEWDEFWTALADFVRILNEKLLGRPFEIDAGGVGGDADMFLKAFIQHRHFETLVESDDPAVRDACLKLALPTG
ncbi:MAG TPA: hypothetical protein VKW08_02410 [Xanthobacteraceae bacterium]|nr:hypothetical protein [Xanthobacteraceae bacterium]